MLLSVASEFQARLKWPQRASSTPLTSSPPASTDPSVTDEPGFDDGKVTPKAFCECVAGKLEKNNASQKDVDMLTKMHNEEISDADAEAYPTLEDLMNANEGFEDSLPQEPRPSCRPTTRRSRPMEEDAVPEDGAAPDEGAPPAQDEGSPPQ